MYTDLGKYLKLIHQPNEIKPWFELEYICSGDFGLFIELADRISNITHLNPYRQPILFRGQADSNWTLKPYIYRLLEKLPLEKALELEFDSINHFKQVASMFLRSQIIPEEKNIGAWLALMQQYGSPTMMLDWSTSFNVALYFAVTDEPIEKPGAVWFFEVSHLLKYMEKYEDISPKDADDILTNGEKFVEFGCNKASPKIDTYDINIKSERIIAQQSLFTYCLQLFCDQALIICSILSDEIKNQKVLFPLTKLIINPNDKQKIRIHLNKLNITAATLFPGIDGAGRSISELIRAYFDVFHSN